MHPQGFFTQRAPLASAIDAFHHFDRHEAGWLKVKLEPGDVQKVAGGRSQWQLVSGLRNGLALGRIEKKEAKMRSKRVNENPRTYVIVLETGDEVLPSLKGLAQAEGLAGSSFKAIGALSSVELGWFNWESKKYQTAVKLDEQVELLSLIGDIALKDNEPQVHAHLVIGRRDGTAHGGHLLSATVRPTCEIVVTESPQHLQKQIDPESGLALIRL